MRNFLDASTSSFHTELNFTKFHSGENLFNIDRVLVRARATHKHKSSERELSRETPLLPAIRDIYARKRLAQFSGQ